MLTHSDLPEDKWEYRYQIGFFIGHVPQRVPLIGGYPIIIWRTVPRAKFLNKYYDWVSLRSSPIDALAVFHAGDIQRFRRQVFRALTA